jgi:hypothetical protein
VLLVCDVFIRKSLKTTEEFNGVLTEMNQVKGFTHQIVMIITFAMTSPNIGVLCPSGIVK